MITTPQHSFIQLCETPQACACAMLPVQQSGDIAFYLSGSTKEIRVYDSTMMSIHSESFIKSHEWVRLSVDLSKILASGDCFCLGFVEEESEEVYYSNLFVYDALSVNTSLVEYWGASTDNFPFEDDKAKLNSIRLPIIVKSPQPVSESESYIDGNGRINFPFKTKRQKYSGTTDFMTFDQHSKFQLALMHGLLRINGFEMSETGDYKIDWDGKNEEDNTATATFEVQEQYIIKQRL
jgi:hypothetical protein